MNKRGKGENCHYCGRSLDATRSPSRVAATKDHVIPRVHGGGRTVWCCRQCNSVKGAKTADEWDEFMATNPRWWEMESYRHHGRLTKPLFNRSDSSKRKRSVVKFSAGKQVLMGLFPEWYDMNGNLRP